MTNLTQVAYLSRKFIKYGAIGLSLFVVLQTSFRIFKEYYKEKHPPPPPQPTVAFKKLPAIKFPEDKNLPTLTYTLETIQGSLPTLETIGKVYVSVKPSLGLLSFDRLKEVAAGAGFKDPPEAVSPRRFRFISRSAPTTILEIDMLTHNFIFRYEYASDPNIFAEKKLPTNEQAIAEARSFLEKMGLLTRELQAGNATVSYLKYSITGLLSAISLSEADFVKVVLLKQDLDNLKVLPEKPSEGPVSFLFSGSRDPNKRILEINYTLNKIDTQNFATYPLKSSNAAWQELLDGKGYIANLGENQDGKIIIRRVFLAYYDSSEPQNFIQPIFVFEGDRSFMAYVPAVNPKWID